MALTIKKITLKNLYNFYTIQEGEGWSHTGFEYVPTDEMEKLDKPIYSRLDDKMMNEFNIGYERGMDKRSCKWADEVKRRANWVPGETLYGYTREKHTCYQIWWSKDKQEIGFYTFVIEANGYLSLHFFNGYTDTETNDTKYNNYIRPGCLHNDQVCDLLRKV